MNRKHHRWIVRREIIMKCANRFCNRKGHSLRGETRGSHVSYSMNIHPIEGKHIDDIRSPDDIAKVIICRIRPVPMITKFLAMAPVADKPCYDGGMPELSGSRIADVYEYYLKAALDNNMIDVIEIS